MSHKTGDLKAEIEAKRIAAKHHVRVYMAEWDENVTGDTNELPDQIMRAIQESDAFLVHVIAQIKDLDVDWVRNWWSTRYEKGAGQDHVHRGRWSAALCRESFETLDDYGGGGQVDREQRIG